ncbi:MAG: hypothetical protein ACQERG_08360 [Pseudomonadota bacterium]|jgi:hypothetical protein|uniref:Uncharacterized protein n=1 Tax=Thiohalospira halophila DSM 15071 TaxID=1123397 RepID=A0A1I1VC23_9GAMM|nr:hypothetical protein [Thiohalospira halophila]SFD80572.1 hypothetical protein SAMN05660831_02335 [Thiohalospira halophila DSM 15071]
MIRIGPRGSQNRTTNTAEMKPEELRKIAQGETKHRARDRKRAQAALEHRGLAA